MTFADYVLGFGVLIAAITIGIALMKKASPQVSGVWKWLSSHLAFLFLALCIYQVATATSDNLYVEPTRLQYNGK